MMKGGLGGGSKKEGKMRIRAFPVKFIIHFILALEYLCYCFLVSLTKDDDGREVCGKYLEFTEECHSRNSEEE